MFFRSAACAVCYSSGSLFWDIVYKKISLPLLILNSNVSFGKQRYWKQESPSTLCSRK